MFYIIKNRNFTFNIRYIYLHIIYMKRKIIIIEGQDNTGKDTLINKLKSLSSSVNIFHCEKPKSLNNKDAAIEQDKLFLQLSNDILKYQYDITILNRAWYGEYVYGCMYRGRTDEEVKKIIYIIEKNINEYKSLYDDFDIYYINLYCDSENLLYNNDDGKSLSNAKIELLKEEARRFNEIFNYSSLNKKNVKVNDGDSFRKLEDIHNEVIEFVFGQMD